jgi:crotonobetainyl-CoA:carnitine CoA-transferase CaiB-like acyl-CoA transferase
VPALPETYAPLRSGAAADVAREAEDALAAAFGERPAAESVTELRRRGALAEPVTTPDRDGFRRGILDDPVNRELGRVVAYETADWGHFEQIGPLLRCGPDADGGPALHLPGVGEHTTDALAALGFTPAEIAGFLDAKVARQG